MVLSLFYDDAVVYLPGPNFRSNVTAATGVNGPRFIELSDIDADGDMDLFVPTYNGHEFRWYRNDGAGVFALSQTWASVNCCCQSDGLNVIALFPSAQLLGCITNSARHAAMNSFAEELERMVI